MCVAVSGLMWYENDMRDDMINGMITMVNLP